MLKRLETVRDREAEIKGMIRELIPSLELVTGILKDMDAPVCAADLGIDREMTRDCIVVAKEVRNRYTLLQLLWDLGLLEEMAEEIAAGR